MSNLNEKAMKGILFLILLSMVGFYYYNNIYLDNVKKNDTSNKADTKTEEKIGDINDVKLFVTDYRYDSNLKGYNYNVVNLTTSAINDLKTSIKDINFKSERDIVVYGKYKLVLDDKIIFFDLGNDYALYYNSNIVIKFPNSIKSSIAKSTDTCSCCTTSNCKINLCSCSNTN